MADDDATGYMARMPCDGVSGSEDNTMPPRRVRFTMRRMMAIVALVALLFETETLRRRRRDFLVRAEKCDASARAALKWANSYNRKFGRVYQEEIDERAQAAEFVRKARHYRYAAAYPWLVFEPDPASP